MLEPAAQPRSPYPPPAGEAPGYAVVSARSGPSSQGPYAGLTSLEPVFRLGDNSMVFGACIGVAIALLTHGFVVAQVMMALVDMSHFYREARVEVRDFLWTTYDIEPAEKEQPKIKEEEPLPEPEPEPEPVAKVVKPEEDIYKETKAAAAPAKAMDIVTGDPDSQEPESFYDIVDNDGGKGANYGKVSNEGKGEKPVTGPTKKHGVEGGGGGNDTKDAQPKAVDKSRPPTLLGSTSWNCPFPAEADAEGRDSAVAVITVTVRKDGSPQSVTVLTDPGTGFGRAARMCALGKRYQAGLDKEGNATVNSTPPIRVRFSR